MSVSMSRFRPAIPADLPAIVEHLAQFEHGYSDSLDDAGVRLLTHLLKEGAIRGLLLENPQQGEREGMDAITALGITAFLTLPCAQAMLEDPPEQPVASLCEREARGERVFLRPPDIARHNARDGMALMFLHFSAPPGDPSDPLVSRAVMRMQEGFRLQHGGFHCRLLLHPAPSTKAGIDSLLTTGFRAVGSGRSLFVFDTDQLTHVPFHPFTVLRRTAAPTLGFSAAEQDMLMHALLGAADVEIARQMHITVETVRKRWRSIFNRVTDHPTARLFPNPPSTDKATRGPEKRGVLLQYLSSHLEELRPYSVPDEAIDA